MVFFVPMRLSRSSPSKILRRNNALLLTFSMARPQQRTSSKCKSIADQERREDHKDDTRLGPRSLIVLRRFAFGHHLTKPCRSFSWQEENTRCAERKGATFVSTSRVCRLAHFTSSAWGRRHNVCPTPHRAFNPGPSGAVNARGLQVLSMAGYGLARYISRWAGPLRNAYWDIHAGGNL